MGIRNTQKELRRRAILEAGLDALIAKGYSGTTIADIAERAHMSIGLLFHYFANTEKLYEALTLIGVQGTQFLVQDGTPVNALVFFEHYAKTLLQEVQKNSFTAKMFLLMSLAHQSQDTPETVKKCLKEINIVDDFSILIVKGQAEGSVKSGNPKALANTFLVCLTGLARQVASDSKIPLPEPSWVVDIIRKRG